MKSRASYSAVYFSRTCNPLKTTRLTPSKSITSKHNLHFVVQLHIINNTENIQLPKKSNNHQINSIQFIVAHRPTDKPMPGELRPCNGPMDNYINILLPFISYSTLRPESVWKKNNSWDQVERHKNTSWSINQPSQGGYKHQRIELINGHYMNLS